jgi:hypothetical protein
MNSVLGFHKTRKKKSFYPKIPIFGLWKAIPVTGHGRI